MPKGLYRGGIYYGIEEISYIRISFSRGISIPFARGQIDGYFDGDLPDNFFPTLRLYIAFIAISSIPWAIPFDDREIKTMLDIAKCSNEDFNGFKSCIPVWYR